MEGTAYPYAHPYETAASQFLEEGTKAVMAGMSPIILQFYPPERDIEVIVYDDEVLDGNIMEIHGCRNGAPGEIHEGLGLQKEEPLSLKDPISIKAGKAFPGYCNPDILGKSV
jgi:hypothetical protein